MKTNTLSESDRKVLEMYKDGYSCKDICNITQIPLMYVRNLLQDNGFDTRSYRNLSDSNQQKVLLLVKAGYSYPQIEKHLHVSTHAIREAVLRGGLLGVPQKNKAPIVLQIKKEALSTTRLHKLRDLYLSGMYGLAKCADLADVTDDELLYFIYYLTAATQHIHSERVCNNIKKMSAEDLPASVIAKKMDISLSLVKKHLNKGYLFLSFCF